MISAIVCVDKNWGIGSNGDLLIHIPEDMKFFKKMTTNNLVIMGRKTFDSLHNKPLQNRINCIITSKVNLIEYNHNNNYYLMNMDYIKEYLLPMFLKHDYLDIFIIGGGQIYKELLPYCECVYVTKILQYYNDVDTYFPNIDNMSEWEIKLSSEIKCHNDIKYQFCEYRKKW